MLQQHEKGDEDARGRPEGGQLLSFVPKKKRGIAEMIALAVLGVVLAALVSWRSNPCG